MVKTSPFVCTRDDIKLNEGYFRNEHRGGDGRTTKQAAHAGCIFWTQGFVTRQEEAGL